jgi:EAL domain-containing protein (putative c-di-GMP-specific phosphodiesterase class I)
MPMSGKQTGLTEESYLSLLRDESIATLFHPIVSVKKKRIFAYEALSRGVAPDGSILPPDQLFRMAGSTGTSLELDRLCRRKALENFIPLAQSDPDCLLSINIDSSIIGVSRNSNNLLNTVRQIGVDPSFVIIEILESNVQDMDILSDFVNRYRENNFLIAIDDIGSGFSNLERVIILKPDVIKIDRSLVSGIDENFYKREVVRSIASLAHGIGSVIIAEGVETREEAIACLELGCDYLQGFLFSRPARADELSSQGIDSVISSIADDFRKKMISRVPERHASFNRFNSIIERIVSGLAETEAVNFEEYIREAVRDIDIIECVYIIDESGIQVSRTIFREKLYGRKRIFRPDRPGADQSFKDYFFYLKTGLRKYTSGRYISGASGRLCTTISTIFRDSNMTRYVLCCDIVDDDTQFLPSC